MKTLRNKYIEQMQMKGYSVRTIKTYTDTIIVLSKYYNTSPDLLSIEPVRHYLHEQLTKKSSVNRG